jgi:hypothetical protein
VHNFDVSAVEYRGCKPILGTYWEKILDAGFSGLNIRAGDVMAVRLNYNTSGINDNTTTGRLADRIHIVFHSDQILEI